MRTLRPAALFAGLVLLRAAPALAAPLPDASRIDPGLVASADVRDTEAAFLRMYYDPKMLVETATRAPKPLDQIAENVTVITAAQIEDMNAHTVAEVLQRVTGVFVDFWGQDFGSSADVNIQGSDNTHVTVLLDGVPMNLHLNGEVSTDQIPVGIIDRIEIVKGPASSSWGSALGGVINVITRPTGRAGRADGQLSASYGEADSHDVRGRLNGRAGPVGYFLQAGELGSGGLVRDRGAERYNVFSKLSLGDGDGWAGTLTFHNAIPYTDLGDAGGYDFDATRRTSLVRLELAADPAPEWRLNAAVYRYDQVLELGFEGPGWSMYPVTDEHTLGLQGSAVRAIGPHTAVLGADYLKGFTNRDDFTGTEASRERAGLYGNATLSWGTWTFTPGLRYDRDSRVDPFWSPSVGATWQIHPTTLLRGTLSRGFNAPTQLDVAGFPGRDGNPDLKPEQIWSWQGGVETTALPYLWLKLTAFRHEVTDAFTAATSSQNPANVMIRNRDWEWRTGGEAEVETASYLGLSGRAGFAYVHIERTGVSRAADRYTWDLILRCLQGPFGAELAGHYVRWDQPPDAVAKGEYGDFLWDLNLHYAVAARDWGHVELFGTAHNLFNGDQYYNSNRPNPDRWVEGGVRVRF